jgi:hypothetical protein
MWSPIAAQAAQRSGTPSTPQAAQRSGTPSTSQSAAIAPHRRRRVTVRVVAQVLATPALSVTRTRNS